jgi:hypothetical protein
MNRPASLEGAPLLVVSPHLDDAWLSCAALLLRSRPLDVLNVFTGTPTPPRSTPWDLRSGFPDSAATVAARRLEDDGAFAGTTHRRTSLGLLTTSYLDGPRDPADAEVLAAAVADWAGSAGDDAVVALPAGAGSRLPVAALRVLGWAGRFRGRTPRNSEHVYVRDAALRAIDRTKAVPLLYEELPYLWSGSGDRQARRTASALRRRAVELTLTVDRDEKARRLASYASQLASFELRLDGPGVLPPSERYWLLERPASA